MTLTVLAPDGVPEVRRGDDLADLLLAALAGSRDPLAGSLADGDIVLVTSKVVAKAEGRVRPATTREAELAGETVRVVARRGATAIVRNRLGLTMAAAGIDASNVEAGSVVLLPEAPDRSAAAMRAALRERAGVNVAVVVTDTAGRAWREGQTDIAIGAAGLAVLEDHRGAVDGYGNALAVTLPAVADELASTGELVQGKLGGRPFAVVRGRADLVLAPGDDGPGAVALIRAEGGDFFGFGAREAVVRALAGLPGDRAPFGAPAHPEELLDAIRVVTGRSGRVADGVLTVEWDDRLVPLAFAHGWVAEPGADGTAVLRPA